MERAPPLPFGQLPPEAPVPPPLAAPAHPDGVVTLLVKHLPDALSADTLLRLFSHYGASDVRPCVAGRLKNCAFVDFKDDVQATRAQSQLHRLQFLGKTLAVERAKPLPVKAASDKADAKGVGQEEDAPPLPTYPHPHEQGGLQPMMSTGINSKTTAVSGFKLEPIAPSLGVDYPFPPHLEYAYPPPDGNILTNIVNALIAVPRFYTQVLHLMNKMNLPAPFRPALPTPPLPPPPPEPAAPKPQDRDLSSDESELESSEDDGTVERKEVITSTSHVLKKRKVLAKDAEGAKPTSLVPKERALIKKRQPVLQINISAKGSSREHAPVKEHTHDEGKMQLDKAEPSLKDSTVEPRISATREELVAGRMPLNEILVLPMFKNYTKGIPTPVLYVKNLAKDVTQDDLYHVFGAVFPKSEDIRSQLSVKLMQEGRMRGQAFVTFPSTDLAEDALSTVHGFILKGKPMIVQFGRNPAAVKTTTD